MKGYEGNLEKSLLSKRQKVMHANNVIRELKCYSFRKLNEEKILKKNFDKEPESNRIPIGIKSLNLIVLSK